jgi:hypothetical protein
LIEPLIKNIPDYTPKKSLGHLLKVEIIKTRDKNQNDAEIQDGCQIS